MMKTFLETVFQGFFKVIYFIYKVKFLECFFEIGFGALLLVLLSNLTLVPPFLI